MEWCEDWGCLWALDFKIVKRKAKNCEKKFESSGKHKMSLQFKAAFPISQCETRTFLQKFLSLPQLHTFKIWILQQFLLQLIFKFSFYKTTKPDFSWNICFCLDFFCCYRYPSTSASEIDWPSFFLCFFNAFENDLSVFFSYFSFGHLWEREPSIYFIVDWSTGQYV